MQFNAFKHKFHMIRKVINVIFQAANCGPHGKF